MESNLPKTLHELAVMDKLPKGAYVDLPDRSAAWFVESVQQLADEVYTVNGRQDVLFTGFEPVTVYFDVRSFAVVMREIMTYRLIQIANGKPPTDKQFWAAQKDITELRAKLEKAYRGASQKAKKGEPIAEIWMFGIEAYQRIVLHGERLDNVLRMSNTKLAEVALKYGQGIVGESKELGEVAYFYKKR